MAAAKESVTREAIKAISAHAANALLKPAGFKRRAQNFVRPGDGLFHCLQFQGSRWGSATRGEFTVNVSVPVPIIYEAWFGKEFPDNPISGAFGIGTRIGRLMPCNRDHWWKVSRRTDVDALAAEVTAVFEDYVLPYFDSYPDLDAVLAALRSNERLEKNSAAGSRLMHAIVALELGHHDEAVAQADIARQLADGTPFRSKAVSVARYIIQSTGRSDL